VLRVLLLRLLLELGDFIEDVLSGPYLVDAEQAASSHKSQKLVFATVFGQMLLTQTKEKSRTLSRPTIDGQQRRMERTTLCESVGLPVRDFISHANQW